MTKENIGIMISNILDSKNDAVKEMFTDLMRNKIMTTIDGVKSQVGFNLFNKDEYVTEGFVVPIDDVYLTLSRLAGGMVDVLQLNEEWEDMSDEEKTEFTDDDFEWDPEDFIEDEEISEAIEKRYLVRYNDTYRTYVNVLSENINPILKQVMISFGWDNLHENVKPVAMKILSPLAEDVYESISNLDESEAESIGNAVNEMLDKIIPLNILSESKVTTRTVQIPRSAEDVRLAIKEKINEELSLQPLDPNYKKRDNNRSEKVANDAFASTAKPKPSTFKRVTSVEKKV